MVEIGRVDIITEVSMIASQLACPRDSHLEAIYRIVRTPRQQTQLLYGV